MIVGRCAVRLPSILLGILVTDTELKTPESNTIPQVKKTEAAVAVPAKQPDKKLDMERITPGERFYDVFQFMTGKVFILGITALLAFTAHKEYGPDKVAGIPNYLKKLQVWAEKKFEPLAKMGEEGSKKRDFGMLMAGGLTSTLILSHGGNFFAPVIKWLENSREKITNAYNKKFGTAEDVEIAHEKFKDIPKQNWGDVIKGRLTAYATVFSSITGAYLAFGRSKNPHSHFKLDTYEEWLGRKVAWLSKESHDIAKTPMSEALTHAQKANKTYRFGKVLAIDLFATSTAIIVWNTVSRLSAKNRVEAEAPSAKAASDIQNTDTPASDPTSVTSPTTHAEKTTPCCRKEMLLEGRAASYAKLIKSQQNAEQQAHTISG